MRARDRALRRLAAEHVATYRQLKAQRLAAVPATLSRQRARGRAVSQALSELGKQYPERYRALYEQELQRARSEPRPIRRGRPPGAPDRLSLASASLAATWRREGPGGSRPNRQTQGARRRAEREAVRLRTAVLFQRGHSATSVAAELGVARQTAVSWQARWREGGAAALRSRGPSRRPAVPDSQLPAIEQALLKGAGAHGFDGDVWTVARAAVVIQRVTGVQLGAHAVQRLLHDRLGWSVQPMTGRQRGSRSGARTAPTGAPGGRGTGQDRS
jgi:transposase